MGKVFNSIWYNLNVFGQIFIAENGQLLKTQSGHLVTLLACFVLTLLLGQRHAEDDDDGDEL